MTVTEGDYLRAVQLGADGLADHYGAQLDAASHAVQAWAETVGAVPQAAASYVRAGLRVFPLEPGGKRPLPGHLGCCGGSHRRGCTDALGAEQGGLAAVVAWWREHPDANVGIATGHGVDVIDQDGPAGALSWLALSEWPAVIGVAVTPREGGVHRYVAATGRGNGAAILPGIDYRGLGGYVVAPPSVIDGRRYAWAEYLALA